MLEETKKKAIALQLQPSIVYMKMQAGLEQELILLLDSILIFVMV